MRVLSSEDQSTGSAELVEALAGRIRATDAGAQSLSTSWLSAPGAVFGEER